MDAGHLAAGAAPKGLAVQGDRIAQIGTTLFEPRGQDLLVGAGVKPAEYIGESRLTRSRPVGEAERLGQLTAVVAGELRDRFQALHPSQQGDRGKV